MAKLEDILTLINEKSLSQMTVDTSARDYCILAIQFIKGQSSPNPYFESELPSPQSILEEEISACAFKNERYCRQLYHPSSELRLADVIADLSFAQAERLTLVTPENPQADDRERAMVYVVAVYTFFALALHKRTDFVQLFLEAWNNFNMLASSRVIRKRYDKSWHSRYSKLFYPLG